MHCTRLVVVVLAALLLCAQCTALGDDLRRLTAAATAPDPDRSQKIAEAALSTQDAIGKAVNRGSVNRATAVGAKMTAAATDSGISSTDMNIMNTGAQRHLLKDGPSGRQGEADPQTSILRAEKMSDAALSTQAAIMKGATVRGSINKATVVGTLMTAAATDPSVSHGNLEMLDRGGRKLATEGRPDAGSLDGALAASAEIAKAVNTPSLGAAKYATARGSELAKVVSTPGSRFSVDFTGARRHLLKDGPSGRQGEADPQTGILRAEKMSDAALSTQAAIMKGATTRGSINKATAVGTLMTAAATDPSVSHGNLELLDRGGRKLATEGRPGSDMGSLDGALAASAEIAKAVKTPSMGSVKYATARGSQLAKVVSNPGSRFAVDFPLRKLSESKGPRRLLGL